MPTSDEDPLRSRGVSRRRLLRLGAGAAGGLVLPGCLGARGCGAGDDDLPPNVLLLVADDFGLECVGAYGGTTFATPHIDAVAASGMRFRNVFATPACAPSRAELLTGRYPFRTGWIDNAGPLSPRSLAASEPTFARTLRDGGYATAIAGKWQLGSLAERPSMPQDSGFTESLCWSLELIGGRLRASADNSRYFAPRLWRNGRRLETEATAYAPELEFSFLTEFMARNASKPFLAYHAMNLPHAPYHVPPGYDPPSPRTTPEQSIAATYALMISYMDELVGRYVARLAELGLAHRTFVFFTSDNGGNENFVVSLGDRRIRGGKFTLGESGANVPFLASRPGVVPAGAVCDELVDFTDVLPTFAALGRTSAPRDVRLDGWDFAPSLAGRGTSARPWVFCQLGRQAFIRDRAWRLSTDGRLFRVVGTYADEPADAASDPEARAAYDGLRAALLGLLGEDAKRLELAPALLRGVPRAPAPTPAAGRTS
jgi:arylsulfatase A